MQATIGWCILRGIDMLRQENMDMVWDRPDAHIVTIRAQDDEIDELGHVNNAAYVRWLERCVWRGNSR